VTALGGASAAPGVTGLIAGRFRIVGPLGSGGMGVVFEAFDEELRVTVALKLLRSPSAEGVRRFKNEFRAIVDLHHPNLVSLGELLEDRGRWMLTMELVRGGTFLEWVRPSIASWDADSTVGDALSIAGRGFEPPEPESSDVGTFDEARLREALVQLATGLSALHAAGKVHRDVKPSNVMVDRGGRVVLLDFGIVAEASARSDRAGTAVYMAPEQAETGAVDPAVDWYAVGVMLYQALSGRVPWAGAPAQILAKKRTEAPPPLPPEAAATPDLAALCLRLLSVDPSARPDGREVIDLLQHRRSPDVPATTTPSRPAFVGREGELATLRDCLARARAGALCGAAVVGESGIGKTDLVRTFLARETLENPDLLVLSGRCYERESVPFKAVDAVVEELSAHLATLPDDDLAGLVPDGAECLGCVFPALCRVMGIDELSPGAPEEGTVLRARAFAAMRALLSSLCATKTVVLWVDDLQWTDEDSVLLLGAVIAGDTPPPVLLVATVRNLERSPAAARLLELLGARLTMIPVGPLSEDEACRLARSAALAAGTPLSDGALRTLAHDSHGHPLFVAELARRGDAAMASRPLDDAIRARVDELDEGARRVLELVAVASRPVAQHVIATASALEGEAFTRSVSRLRAGHMVQTTGARLGDRIESWHDRVRAAVADSVPKARLCETHRALAEALETHAADEAESISSHRASSGDPARGRRFARVAAEQAMRTLAFDRAARLFRLALDLGDPDVTALSVRLGDALGSAGRGEAAADAFLVAAGTTPDAGASVELRRRAADQLLRCGRIERGILELRTVLRDVDLPMPAGPKAAVLRLLFRRLQIWFRGLGFRRVRASAVPVDVLRRIDTCWSIGIGLGLVDTFRGAYFQARGLLLALSAGEPTRVARALAAEACFSASSGGKSARRTAELVEASRALAVEVRDPYATAWVQSAMAFSSVLEGRWLDTLGAARSANQQFGNIAGVAWERSSMRWCELVALAYLGRGAELSALAPVGAQDAADRGDRYGVMCHTTQASTLAWLARDEPVDARRRVANALAGWPASPFHVEHWWALFSNVHIDLYEGDATGSSKRIEDAWSALSRSLLLEVQMTRLEALCLRARASIAVSKSTGDASARRAAVRDARRMLRDEMPWSTPLAHLVLAAAAHQEGDVAASRRSLSLAETGFEQASMTSHALVTRIRRAELDEDPSARASALRALGEQGIRDGEKWLRMTAPGL
jgi:hypothetical protein